MPATSGTVTEAGPDETTRFTELPEATLEPEVGLWLITLPAATVELLCVVTVPTLRPTPVIAVVAAACVMPTTLGTVTGAGPDDTTRFTELPDATLEPEVGFWLITLPAATEELLCVVTVPTLRLAPVIAVVAAACVMPTTSGTDTEAGPDETTRFTELPDATLEPEVGLWLITLPAATVELLCVVTVPTLRPTPVIAVVAAACVMPATLGTVTEAGPDETTRFTELPEATLEPEVGLWLITLPAATVELLCVVTVPTLRPTPVIAVV